jgi:carboxymethylenebutenolidase
MVTNTEARSYAVERTVLAVGERRLALSLPKGRDTPISSVLVFHSAMGRTESVLEWCDRLAERGFAAVALDFYDGKTATSPEQGRQLRDSANERSAILRGIVEQAWTAMGNDDRFGAGKRFLLGWSFGGAWATYSSGFLSGEAGVVALYGQAFTDDVNLYDSTEAPILLVGGENDTTPTPDKLRGIVEQLKSKGKTAELLLVPAGHGFAERSHPNYNRDAAEKAVAAVVRFLQANAP